MIFVGDLAGDRAWLTPAPIGVVEPGWVGIVADMLDDVGRALTTAPAATVDVLDLSELDGALVVDLVVDGGDPAVAAAVDAAVGAARRRAATTCSRCSAPGRLRLDRAAWPTTRCDRHVVTGLPPTTCRIGHVVTGVTLTTCGSADMVSGSPLTTEGHAQIVAGPSA